MKFANLQQQLDRLRFQHFCENAIHRIPYELDADCLQRWSRQRVLPATHRLYYRYLSMSMRSLQDLRRNMYKRLLGEVRYSPSRCAAYQASPQRGDEAWHKRVDSAIVQLGRLIKSWHHRHQRCQQLVQASALDDVLPRYINPYHSGKTVLRLVQSVQDINQPNAPCFELSLMKFWRIENEQPLDHPFPLEADMAAYSEEAQAAVRQSGLLHSVIEGVGFDLLPLIRAVHCHADNSDDWTVLWKQAEAPKFMQMTLSEEVADWWQLHYTQTATKHYQQALQSGAQQLLDEIAYSEACWQDEPGVCVEMQKIYEQVRKMQHIAQHTPAPPVMARPSMAASEKMRALLNQQLLPLQVVEWLAAGKLQALNRSLKVASYWAGSDLACADWTHLPWFVLPVFRLPASRQFYDDGEEGPTPFFVPTLRCDVLEEFLQTEASLSSVLTALFASHAIDDAMLRALQSVTIVRELARAASLYSANVAAFADW